MSNLPRLKLKEEESNLKNNDYIIFRHQSKGKDIKMNSTKNNNVNKRTNKKRTNKKRTNKKRTNKNRTHKNRTHKKRRKGFFSIFN